MLSILSVMIPSTTYIGFRPANTVPVPLILTTGELPGAPEFII